MESTTKQWCLFGLIVIVITNALGVFIDMQTTVSQPTLFWCFTVVSLLGLIGPLIWGAKRLDGIGGKVGLVLAIAYAWRISYFPIMVFSGWIASLAERVGTWISPVTVIIYPVFLMSILIHYAAIAAIAAMLFKPVAAPQAKDGEQGPSLLQRLLAPSRKILTLVAAPALFVASAVSFTSSSDFTLLPDRPWSAPPQALPEVRAPRANPYSVRLSAEGYNIRQRILLFNAAMTYDLVPHSPWAASMKGTLEAMVNENPVATSHDRVVEHFLAYIVAHPYIRSDRNPLNETPNE